MATSQFLIRNRHNNVWYGRIIVPLKLRDCFNGKRELRKSLGTSDRTRAKRQALEFWVECQKGFDRLTNGKYLETSINGTQHFLQWLNKDVKQRQNGDMVRYVEYMDVMGGKTVIDLDDPKEEAKLALQLQANSIALFERFKDEPEMLDRLFRIKSEYQITDTGLPETTTPCDEAIDLYIDKLKTSGRKGKQLSQRTLHNYQGRLNFWKEYFGNRPTHEILLKELGEIQDWLPWLAPNYKKRRNILGGCGISTADAINKAKTNRSTDDRISDKTRAEYLGQLKGLLEFCYARGFITSDMSTHIEIPNTKQTKTIERLPFTNEDLKKIFSEDYGVDFGKKASGFDDNAKFWIPLLAVFSGARLEEICQLKTSDIKTDQETKIIYADISEGGMAADGEKKHTKNKNSIRPIPIHSILIAIGFMDYVSQRKKDISDKALFQLKRDKQGRLGKGFSNWFSRFEKRKAQNMVLGYIEKRGVVSKGIDDGQKWSKTFHSFRHAVIDNLRDNKTLASGEHILETHIGIVVGHTKEKSETAQYGKNRSQLELRKDLIEAIDFKDVDFKKIRWL